MERTSPLPSQRRPIAGYVGPGGLILEPAEFFGPHWIEEVELELGGDEGHRIFKVRGNDNFPPYSDGELLFVPDKPAGLRRHIGRDCIVRTRRGEMYLRTLTLGTKEGHYTLLSVTAVPLIDIAVSWASPVERTLPREISAAWTARKVATG